MRFLFLPFSLLVFAGCAAPKPVATRAVLTVSPAPQQTIRGWGIYPCTIQNDRANADLYTLWNRPNAARLIWHDLNPTFWRCEILPGSYDATRDDGSLDRKYLDESLARQIQLARSFGQTRYILSVWSPPAPFKSPPTTRGIDPKTKRDSFLRRERESDYCRFVARVLSYLKQKKLPLPFALSVQNEPGFAAPLWNGTAMKPEQWARLIIEMRAVLDENGFQNVQLIGPEGGSYQMSVAFVGGSDAPVLKDARLRAALGGFAFHGYTIGSKYPPHLENLRSVALEMQRANKSVWMSEWSIPSDKPDPLDHVLETAQRLARETSFIPCNYWTWWQGWYFRHPKGEVLLTGSDDKHLHISKTFWMLRRLWASAPAGSVVHRMSSSAPQLSGFDAQKVQCVAFQSGARQTLLLVNPTTKSKALELRGLTGRTATPFLTDQTRDMAAQTGLVVSGGSTKWTLPPRSVAVVAVR